MGMRADLLAFLRSLNAVTAITGRRRIHDTQAPPQFVGAYLWFARSSIGQERTLDGGPQIAAGEIVGGAAPFRVYFDFEAISDDGAEAQDLADALLLLDGYRGAFGAGTVQGIFVDDAADDYTARGIGAAEDSLEYAALDIQIAGYKPAA